MKKLVSVLMALMVTPLLAAGSDVAGKWTSGKQSTVPVELQLVSSGTTLTGPFALAADRRSTFSTVRSWGTGSPSRPSFRTATVSTP